MPHIVSKNQRLIGKVLKLLRESEGLRLFTHFYYSFRPIAGHANLCPGSISTKRQELDILLSTVKHEMLHALGFSVSLFAFYRDAQGRPLTPRGENGKPKLNEELQTRQWSDRVIRKEARKWKVRGGSTTKDVQVVVTPRVREEVRKHYGCDSLSGAELEDQGEEGTALTHWEKRLFEVIYYRQTCQKH